MAGVARNVMRLLLLAFIRVKRDGLVCAGGVYGVTFPCEEDLVCFRIWTLAGKSQRVAVVVNGELLAAEPEGEGPKCSQQVNNLANVTDLQHYRCPKWPHVSPPHDAPSALAPEFTLMPGKAMSAQCVLLTYVDEGRCSARRWPLSLTWVDEAGAAIQGDSNHHVEQGSACNTTLTVAFQSPQNRKFKCRAAVNERVRTSAELWVRVPVLKGRGRGIIPDLPPDDEEGSRNTFGAGAVVAGGCVVLMALIAAFVLRRRRARNRLPDESRAPKTVSVTNSDDVVYADVRLPVSASQMRPRESTEYACVRY